MQTEVAYIIYIYVCVCVCIFIYMYISREREGGRGGGEREGGRQRERVRETYHISANSYYILIHYQILNLDRNTLVSKNAPVNLTSILLKHCDLFFEWWSRKHIKRSGLCNTYLDYFVLYATYRLLQIFTVHQWVKIVRYYLAGCYWRGNFI